jgi:hypothetical protein
MHDGSPAPAQYKSNGRAWSLAAPMLTSSVPAGTIPSDLHSDYMEVQVDYTLP